MTESQNKTFKCDDKYRNHDLSKTPGGSTIVVEYNNRTIEYPDVKYAKGYMDKIVANHKGNVIALWVKGDMDATIIRLAK